MLGNLTGQDCPQSTVNLYSQQQVNDFINAYPNCTELNVDINLISQSTIQIQNLDGLMNIKRINGDFLIYFNFELQNLNGLKNLESVSGHLIIESNWNLTELKGLESLISVGDKLIIHDNSRLKNLKGLENINFIGSELKIENNEILESFEGINMSEPILGLETLYISYNNQLTSLQSLENFELRRLSKIVIYNNDRLETCAMQSLCNYVAQCKAITLINNNSDECDDKVKLRSSCSKDSDINYQINCITNIYPNPVNDEINIHFNGNETDEAEYLVMDMQNRLLMEVTKGKGNIDVSKLHPGIYTLRIKTEGQTKIFRFIKN